MGDWRSKPRKKPVDPAWLRRVYSDEKRPVGEIAAEAGYSITHLNELIGKFGIERRDGRAGRIIQTRRAPIDIDEVKRLYLDELRSCDAIAEAVGCESSTINRRLRKAGVILRASNDTKRGAQGHSRIEVDVNAVVANYRVLGEGVESTALKFEVSMAVIYRVLREAEESRKPLNQIRLWAGESHPSWNPDLPPHERAMRRDANRQNEWRVQVYERDNYTCQCCGDGRGGNLQAHHIVAHNENRELRWELSNGIALCVDCHRAFHRRYGIRGFGHAELDQFLQAQAQAA